jgi:UDP-N-acetyl-2-amino-2-deoxyglucuronate dehydrogenase
VARRLRFGIVGAGVIGSTHAEAIAGLPDGQLIAVADNGHERAEKLAEQYGITAYTNLQQMLDREELDVVNICTPSGLHGEQACQVMRSGRHVIVEKPMEISLAAIDEMLRVQRETGVKLAVISQHRFDSASRQVHDLVEQKAFGRLVLGNAHVPWWRSQAYYDSGAWRGTWALDGGGVLMNQSIHSIDLLQWLMGPVKSVCAYTDTLAHRIETEDVAVAVLRFASGALGTIGATTAAYPGVTTRVEVYGDRGSAVLEDDVLTYLHLARDDAEEPGPYGSMAHAPKQQRDVARGSMGVARGSVPEDKGPAGVSPTSHALQIADMIRAIRADGTPLVDGLAGRRPVAIVLGIYESARRREEVSIA